MTRRQSFISNLIFFLRNSPPVYFFVSARSSFYAHFLPQSRKVGKYLTLFRTFSRFANQTNVLQNKTDLLPHTDNLVTSGLGIQVLNFLFEKPWSNPYSPCSQERKNHFPVAEYQSFLNYFFSSMKHCTKLFPVKKFSEVWRLWEKKSSRNISQNHCSEKNNNKTLGLNNQYILHF